MSKSNGQKITFAENAAAGTSTDYEWKGGDGFFVGEATWGGGSAKLQFCSPNGTWIDYTSGSLSANGGLSFKLPPGRIRAVTATGSAFYVYAIAIT